MNAATRSDVDLDTLGTVLVVEDEVLIRLDLADHLRLAGYRVIEASNGDEALTVLQSIDTVSLMISDIRMPGQTDGTALATWVRREMPHVKVILVSGHRPTTDMTSISDMAFEKPVHPDFLVRRVTQLLDDTET
jgi:DNA-binding NtrC family response regulator